MACSNMVPSAPVTVFCRESFAGLGRPGCGIPCSPTRLEDLTPGVEPLWVASGDEYPTLDDRRFGGLQPLPRIMHPGFAGVRLTRGTSCHSEVVEIGTMGR